MSSKRGVLVAILALAALGGCTKKGELAKGDCVETVDEIGGQHVYLVTQISEGQAFGNKYINTEQGHETVEVDTSEGFKRVDCPDAKTPPSPVE